MTREEWKAWAMSLKPGDRVVVKHWNGLDIATVVKITPSGRINTDQGVFYQDNCFDHYQGYGKTCGDLVPVTPDLIAEAERQKWEEIEAKHRKSVIQEAWWIVQKLNCGEIDMPYDMAEELIALVKKYTGGNENG